MQNLDENLHTATFTSIQLPIHPSFSPHSSIETHQ
jgi:hypothetical protein